MNQEEMWHLTRQAWIDGVTQYYPGTPKPSYVTPWEQMEAWEQDAIKLLCQHVSTIILPLLKQDIQLPRQHGGVLVCSIWNVLLFQILRSPKPSYVKPFEQLDEWQQRTDIKMFEAIESALLQDSKNLQVHS